MLPRDELLRVKREYLEKYLDKAGAETGIDESDLNEEDPDDARFRSAQQHAPSRP